MRSAAYERDRRSVRMFSRIRVVVSGKNKIGKRFREACETIVINAHGGLLYTTQPIVMGSTLILNNPFTQEEQEARVVYLGDESRSDKGQRLGIEFLTPAPHFWGVEFAPADWNASRMPTSNPTPASQN